MELKIILAIWRQILMFKVSKWPYLSARHDRINCNSATASLVAKKETKKLSQPLNTFWCSRWVNNHIDVPDMIGLFSSGTTTSLMAKNVTEKLSQLFEDGFWFSNCLNDCMKVPDMIGSFATSATASLLAINETSRRGMECPKLLGSEYNKKLPWCWGNVKGERVFQKLILSCVIKIFGCCSKHRGG